MTSENKLKAVTYSRVSTLLGQDPQNQLVALRNMAEIRSFEIIEDYIDIGLSGTLDADKRPALSKLIKDANDKKFTHILIYSLDRLGRNTKHMLNLISDLHSLGIYIISIRENIDFSTPVGQATLTILSAVAQLEVQLIRERIKTALASKKQLALEQNTGWRCGRPKIVNDEIEAKVIELRDKNLSIRAIARLAKVSRGSVERILRKCHKKIEET